MHFEIAITDGRWHWRLVDEAGVEYARSPEAGYGDEHALTDALSQVRRGAAAAYVELF